MNGFRHIKRRDGQNVGKGAEHMDVDGRRRRGGPRKRWKECTEHDLIDIKRERVAWRRGRKQPYGKD